MSIKDLATLMIILSDNTATDIVMDIVGKENVNCLLRDLGLIKTSFPKNTKELLADAFGIDLTKVKGKAFLELFREKAEKGEVNPKTIVLSEIPDNNITTPSEMGLLLEKLTQGYMLSDKSRDEAIEIMLRQQLNTRIPLLLPFGVEVAHKTGTLLLNINGKITGVVNDAGIIYTNNDKEIVLSVFTKNVDDIGEASLLIAKIAKTVYNYFTE